MKTKCLLMIILLTAIVACRKTYTNQPGSGPVNPPPPPPPPPSVIFDTSSVRLKDLTARNLPSPYYHFAYNDSGYITDAVFASGLRIYGIEYEKKRILRMFNNTFANKDVIEYKYVNGELIAIEVSDQAGFLIRKCFVTFSAEHKLQKLEWQVMGGLVLIPEQTFELQYYADGNLETLTTRTLAVGPQLEGTSIDKFENYDNKKNVDGFTLLHPSQMQHLVLLPSSGMQLNNPRRQIHTGSGANTLMYTINYNYIYDAAGRPLVKTGDLLFTGGANNGQHFETQETFSYYD